MRTAHVIKCYLTITCKIACHGHNVFQGYVDPHVGSKYDLMGENGQFSVKHEEANFCAEIEEIEDETNRCT